MARTQSSVSPRTRPTRGNAGPRVPPSSRVNGKGTEGPDLTTDSLQNLITGMGTNRDKTTGTLFTFQEIPKEQLDAAYRGDWIARKVIDIPPEDGTREWREWQADKTDITALEDLERAINLPLKTQLAMQAARLYGGAALLIGVDQGSISSPLDVEAVGKDSLKFIHVVNRWQLASGPIDWDINSEYYGTPLWYRRAQTASGVQSPEEQIHPSRIVRFVGSALPDINLSVGGWGDSILQTVRDAIIAAGIAAAGGANMLQETQQDVISIPNLTANLSNKDYEARLTSRFAAASLMKSLYKIVLLDKEENWQRWTAQMTGIADLVMTYLHIVAGAADIPATRLLGQSPKGLSATGASDTRNYYDLVATKQSTMMTPAMSKLDEVLIRSALGTGNPSDITYAWTSLWQLDEVQKATVAGTKATAYKTDVDAGQIPPEVLRDARINQLLEDETYPGLDQILDDYGPLDPIQENIPGSVVGPNGEQIPPTDPAHPLHPANPANVANNNNPPAPGQKGAPPSVQKNKARAGGRPATGDAMSRRIRSANPKARKWRYAQDGILRTLYVYRSVLNTADIIAWAKEQGIASITQAEELHVTIAYSRTPVDWMKTGEPWGQSDDGTMLVPPGGMRVVQKMGDALVLIFNSSNLSWRHCTIKEAGASWDYEDYMPHVSISYEPDATSAEVLAKVEPYQGEIKLGPEVFSEATRGEMLADFNPYHDPETGQFAASPETHLTATTEAQRKILHQKLTAKGFKYKGFNSGTQRHEYHNPKKEFNASIRMVVVE